MERSASSSFVDAEVTPRELRRYHAVEMTDAMLVRCALDGDPAAFTMLVDRHAAICLRFATRMLGSAEDAVTRVMGVHGDTLNPSVLAGTITTDANGAGALQNLPGGYYTFLATPPAGSGYVKSSFGIAAPTTTDVKVRILLQRAP